MEKEDVGCGRAPGQTHLPSPGHSGQMLSCAASEHRAGVSLLLLVLGKMGPWPAGIPQYSSPSWPLSSMVSGWAELADWHLVRCQCPWGQPGSTWWQHTATVLVLRPGHLLKGPAFSGQESRKDPKVLVLFANGRGIIGTGSFSRQEKEWVLKISDHWGMKRTGSVMHTGNWIRREAAPGQTHTHT